MTADEFLNIVRGCRGDIVRAIETGAQWEIYAQAFIAMALQRSANGVAREVPYGVGNASADLVFSHAGQRYVVEIKVESAHHIDDFAGRSLAVALQADVTKIRGFPNVEHRWVLCIAYGVRARAILRDASAHGFFAAFHDDGTLAIAVIDAASGQWA
jgi:hypothetical protein